MRTFILVLIASALILAITGYFGYADPKIKILQDSFKTILTFTIVILGGTLIKSRVEEFIHKVREKNRKSEVWENEKGRLVKEMADVFSGFYSVRKLWETYKTGPLIYCSNDNEQVELRKELTSKAVELEGKYGALKILIISHFKLREGGYGTKTINDLLHQKKKLSKSDEILRINLDLLGEAFDYWRHAFRENGTIEQKKLAWQIYEEILFSLSKSEVQLTRAANNSLELTVLVGRFAPK
jgi:hypothetical protein